MQPYTPIEYTLPEVSGISQKQLSEHLTLYKGYVTHVNKLHEEIGALTTTGGHEHEISELRRRLGFEFCGMRLHEYYFGDLVGGSKPLPQDSPLHEALIKQYGSFEACITEIKSTLARGTGWIILNYDPVYGRFHTNWVDEHHIGHLATLPVIVAIDMWEHAYMVDYLPGEKKTYLENYLHAINFETVASRFSLRA